MWSVARPVSDEDLSRARADGPDGVVDAELVARAREGDSTAFGDLVRRHLAVAFATARPLVATDEDAEDVCQDAFIRALERLDDCREPDHFRAWFLSIVRNRAHNVRKYQQVRHTEPLEGERAGGSSSPEADAERAEMRERTEEALKELTELQRSVLVLHDHEGWKHAEIGARLGISDGGSRFHLHAARKRLRSLLADLAPSTGRWTSRGEDEE
ncbi:MAG: sigma-70 family RNA polymerase sigma factor [Gemmatimonadota bacterium]